MTLYTSFVIQFALKKLKDILVLSSLNPRFITLLKVTLIINAFKGNIYPGYKSRVNS